jgi:hypothetical protein
MIIKMSFPNTNNYYKKIFENKSRQKVTKRVKFIFITSQSVFLEQKTPVLGDYYDWPP